MWIILLKQNCFSNKLKRIYMDDMNMNGSDDYDGHDDQSEMIYRIENNIF